MGGFGGGVHAEIGEAAAGAGAGDDHQLAAESVARGLVFHDGDGGSAAVDGAEEIGLEDLVDVLVGESVEAAGEGVAGVADEGVEAAEFVDGGLDDFSAFIGIGDVGGEAGVVAA